MNVRAALTEQRDNVRRLLLWGGLLLLKNQTIRLKIRRAYVQKNF